MKNGNPTLHVVDTATGELRAPDCEQCRVLADQLAGAEKEVRRLRAENQALLRDVEADAREHPLWSEARALFDYWRGRCHRGKARFDAKRFYLVLPFIEKDGVPMCRRAIDGAAYDCFTTRRRNGAVKHHDGWELIFRDRGHFDDFCERAPMMPEPGELMEVAEQILARMPDDERPTPDRIWDAISQAQEVFRHPAVQRELREEREALQRAQRIAAAKNGDGRR